MSKKRSRRIQETNKEFEEAISVQVHETRMGAVEDDSLFVLDRQGSKSARRRVEVEIVPKKQGTFFTRADKAVLRKLQSREKTEEQRGREKIVTTLADPWTEEEVAVKTRKTQSTTRQHKVTLPVPGQSYHPRPEDHQDVLAEALAVELKKVEAEKDRLFPALTNEEKTNLLLDRDEEEEEEEEDAEDNTEGSSKSKKQKEKMTKSQRNRQRAHREQLASIRARKTEQALLQSIDKVEQLQKAIEKEEEQQAMAREAKQVLKATKMDEETLDVTSVPLSDELAGSLRCVKPKGVPLREAVKSLVSAGDANAKAGPERSKRQHPHKAPRLKWVAKYKY